MKVRRLLLETLEDLEKEDFKTFQWYCLEENLSGCKPFPKSRLEGASRTETVSKLTESYGEEQAVTITVEILKKMRQNNLAYELKNKYAAAGGTSTSSSAQSPPAATAAPAAGMSAQQGSVIIAPTLTGGTTGSWNITINKP